MLDRLLEGAMPFLKFAGERLAATHFLVFFLMILFFQFSRRMNARAEPAAPSPRRMPQYASALLAKKPVLVFMPDLSHSVQGMRRGLARLLLWADKLLPDAQTGRNLNFYVMLAISLAMAKADIWSRSSASPKFFGDLFEFEAKAFQFPDWAQKAALTLAAIIAFSLLPAVFARKNRELYLDIIALEALLTTIVPKLVLCVRFGCCHGVPWEWGVYSRRLHTTVFPLQLFEFATGLVCFVLCVLYMLFAKSYRPGRGVSACMLAVFVPKFFWDFLRYYEGYDRAVLQLTVPQWFCIAAIALAVLWLFLLPLEKKLMDRFTLFLWRHLRRPAKIKNR